MKKERKKIKASWFRFQDLLTFPHPQENTVPIVDNAIEWRDPAATIRIFTFNNDPGRPNDKIRGLDTDRRDSIDMLELS